MEQITHFSREELQALYQIARLTSDSKEYLETLTGTLQILEELLGFEEGVIHILIGSGYQNVSLLSNEKTSHYLEALQMAVRGKRPVSQAGFSKKKIVTLPLGYTLYAIPIVTKGKLFGSLSFIKSSVGNREELESDFLFLTSVAEMLGGTVLESVMQKSSINELMQENDELRRTLRKLEKQGKSSAIVGDSLLMKKVYREIAQVAPADMTVLIDGETGTGKELVARAIHEKSSRSEKAFIAINCAALPETLLESELFGHKKGAFTGAQTSREGSFMQADGGTIFLDEIGEMSLSAQARLLRVIQEREITPVGGSKPQKVDVRLLCATNKDLSEMVSTGSFREDLFYRINVFPITLPPLRERESDVLLIAEYILQEQIDKLGMRAVSLTDDTKRLLQGYEWPGNIRELRNTIERAVLISHGFDIEPIHLSSHILATTKEEGRLSIGSFEERVAEFERELIVEALKECGGNQRKAAEILKTTKRVIQYKIQKLAIDYQSFK